MTEEDPSAQGSGPSGQERRLRRLEELAAYQEHLLAQLDEATRTLSGELARALRELSELRRTVERGSAPGAPEDDPDEDRVPTSG